MKVKQKLLPCPFCGKTPRKAVFGYGEGVYFVCGECNADGPEVESEAAAVDAWNRRARLSPKDWMPAREHRRR